MAASDALSGDQFAAPKPAKPKADKILAYRYLEHGITFCPTCHRKEMKRSPLEPGETPPKVVRQSDYQPGDLDICTGGCGKTIRGAAETRWDA